MVPRALLAHCASAFVWHAMHCRFTVWACLPWLKGKNLRFSFDRRTDPAQMRELGRVLCNAASVVPQGMVVFLPSFAYASQLRQFWSTDEHGQVQVVFFWILVFASFIAGRPVTCHSTPIALGHSSTGAAETTILGRTIRGRRWGGTSWGCNCTATFRCCHSNRWQRWSDAVLCCWSQNV